ncbi:FAD-dependent pyridine nucleotide-disulfide oxidoreductase [Penicillium verhagenii]|uniref:FAD-dependent pyridine nucleotide-disulfide oxidoreductase n=1 Tax=Penicillium verhagenii TaxID=1562060 RepID=UPI002545B880|nr:FAD-dependent pyridine nucleotide-disulfide oxidoreductase [Penicillium verhagenii]KAJ5939432.1 FAD-dependent pyridine nucleotide-disulfide oxidoreductase [Penicillium verhagenii]
MSRTTVVIIGASHSGLGVANGLLKTDSDKVKVILINPSDKVYFNIAAPRILAKPQFFKPNQYLLAIEQSFSKYPKESFEFIKGTAASINTASKSVELASQQSPISYDYLVIASGSTTSSSIEGELAPFKPMNEHDLETSISSIQKAISSANSVIIGGAGPVGVEFAGELAEAFKDKKDASITLVSASKRVLPMLKEKASLSAETTLVGKGVKIVNSTKVKSAVRSASGNQTGWAVNLDNGEQLQADLYISTTGTLPNNQFIPAEFLSTDGWVAVDENLRVAKGSTDGRIFALGDITTQPLRTAIKVADQVPVVVSNLKVAILGKGKVATYDPNGSLMMIVPIGESTGTGQMFGWKPWGMMVSMVKGKDFFVSKAAGMLGLS